MCGCNETSLLLHIIILLTALPSLAYIYSSRDYSLGNNEDSSNSGFPSFKTYYSGASENLIGPPTPEDLTTWVNEKRNAAWARGAYQFLRSMWCRDIQWTIEEVCKEIQSLPQENITIWITPPGPQYKAYLPIGTLSPMGPYEGVVMLDPTPEASWSHLVLVLLVKGNHSRGTCSSVRGYWLGKYF